MVKRIIALCALIMVMSAGFSPVAAGRWYGHGYHGHRRGGFGAGLGAGLAFGLIPAIAGAASSRSSRDEGDMREALRRQGSQIQDLMEENKELRQELRGR